MPLCVLPFSAMPFSVRYLYDGGFFSISSSYRGLSFTNFDSVYFRFDLTLFTFRLLNFVIDIPSYLSSHIVIINKNHFVNFTGATFVLATHVEGSFSSTSLSGDIKIFLLQIFFRDENKV